MSTDPTRRDQTTPELAGQTALITGAAHGQGRASALALAREGVRIAALDVARPMSYPGYAMGSADDLETLAQECRSLGVDCLTFAVDVRDDVAVTAAVRAVVAQFPSARSASVDTSLSRALRPGVDFLRRPRAGRDGRVILFRGERRPQSWRGGCLPVVRFSARQSRRRLDHVERRRHRRSRNHDIDRRRAV